eukprot:553620-Prymnesium_polylepis.1
MATGNAAATETAPVVVVAAAAPAVAFALQGVVPPLVTAIIALHCGGLDGGPQVVGSHLTLIFVGCTANLATFLLASSTEPIL